MTTFALDINILPVTPLVDLTTGPNDLSAYADGSYQLIFDMSGGATSAGNIRLQISNDGINFTNVGAATAFTAATTNEIIRIPLIDFRWGRINIDVTSGTGGTVAILAHFLTKS